jgi:hypothetical protein
MAVSTAIVLQAVPWNMFPISVILTQHYKLLSVATLIRNFLYCNNFYSLEEYFDYVTNRK